MKFFKFIILGLLLTLTTNDLHCMRRACSSVANLETISISDHNYYTITKFEGGVQRLIYKDNPEIAIIIYLDEHVERETSFLDGEIEVELVNRFSIITNTILENEGIINPFIHS